jgi:hypothetical protein
MKKLLSLLLISFVLVFTVSCNCGGSASNESTTETADAESDSIVSRIKFIEKYDAHQSMAVYEIIAVDGKEYICNSRGGIYPLTVENQPEVPVSIPSPTY